MVIGDPVQTDMGGNGRGSKDLTKSFDLRIFCRWQRLGLGHFSEAPHVCRPSVDGKRGYPESAIRAGVRIVTAVVSNRMAEIVARTFRKARHSSTDGLRLAQARKAQRAYR